MRFKMALKASISGREYDKFTTDDDGNAAIENGICSRERAVAVEPLWLRVQLR